jgi:hypothetical protein
LNLICLANSASAAPGDEPRTDKKVDAEKKAADKKPPEKKADADKKPEPEKKPLVPETKPTPEKKPEPAPVAKPKPTVSREYVSGKKWTEPKIINPGTAEKAPSDAIVLFDGKDLSKEFNGGDGWKVADGVATIGGKGGIETKRPFGSCQLHVEWAAPEEVVGTGQGRGNSGIYIMGKYEVQVLDSYDNTTYFDGQAASLYKQSPPLVNACRKPGEWQSYDILFTAPKFSDDGKEVLSPAYVTVLHNGVLVQNHYELQGGTFFNKPPSYTAHPAKLPLQIQNHGNPVRFRNIWIREL